MNGYRFWFDCETTGLSVSNHQMLEFSVLVEDSKGNTVDHLTCYLRLRDGILPSPSALSVNKINPFSKNWESQSITEWEAAKRLVSLCKKYTSNKKPFFIAYKAEFDRGFVSELLSSCGFNFFDCFNASIIDPYTTAKQLISENKIKTKMLKGKDGSEYPSGKLVDVAEALGVMDLLKNFNLHRSYVDCVLLLLTTKKLYEKILGKSVDSFDVDPSVWKEATVLKVITNSQSSGIKSRTIQILENLNDHQKVIAIDYNSKELLTFNYGTFIQSEPSLLNPLETNGYLTEQKEIAEKWQGLAVSQIDFKEVKKVESYISDSSSVASSIKNITNILSKNYAANIVDEILSAAERLTLALGKKSWTIVKFKKPKIISVKENVSIVCHPGGYYLLNEDSTSLKIFNKNTILNKYKQVKLPNIYSFKQESHPLVIKEEIEKNLNADFYAIALGYKQYFNLDLDIPETALPTAEAFLNLATIESTLNFTPPDISEDFSSKVNCYVFNQKDSKIYKKTLLFKEGFNHPKNISPLGFQVVINNKIVEIVVTNSFELLINSPEYPLSIENENESLSNFYNNLLNKERISSFQEWLSKDINPENPKNWESFVANQSESMLDNFNLENSLKSFDNLWELPNLIPSVSLETLSLKNLDHKHCPLCSKGYSQEHDQCTKRLQSLVESYKKDKACTFKDIKRKNFYLINGLNNDNYLFFCLNTSKKGVWGKRFSALKVEFIFITNENISKIHKIKLDN